MHTESASGTKSYLGVAFARLPIDLLAREVLLLSAQERFSYIVTPNVAHIVRLHENDACPYTIAFRKAYCAATHRVCDSRILQLIARWQGVDLTVAPGSDLTAFLFERGFLDGKKVALVGGRASTAIQLKKRYPAIDLFHFMPPMGLLNDEAAQQAIVSFVRESKCAITLFAVGSPQAEIIAKSCSDDSKIRGVGLCIGASIEFLTGEKVRAPRCVQLARLEWAFRLLSEPRRLGRRYLIEGPRLLRIIRNSGELIPIDLPDGK